ncbi:MAG: hypothetical protein WBH31_13245 [Promethearchaeia archaeon]
MNKKSLNKKYKRPKKEKMILLEYHPTVIKLLNHNDIKYIIWEIITLTE